jgi:hypothetical protein
VLTHVTHVTCAPVGLMCGDVWVWRSIHRSVMDKQTLCLTYPAEVTPTDGQPAALGPTLCIGVWRRVSHDAVV